ncbi:hypothetical protein GCM10022221_21000 [Actinocorallia aurea]
MGVEEAALGGRVVDEPGERDEARSCEQVGEPIYGPAVGGCHLVVEADGFGGVRSEERDQEQAARSQDTGLLIEQRGQFRRRGVDHRVVGQQTAERAVPDRKGFHPRLVEPQLRVGPASVLDHAPGQVEAEGFQPQVVQHRGQMPRPASDVGDPKVPRLSHQFGEAGEHGPRERPSLQPVGEHRRVQLDDGVVRGPGPLVMPHHNRGR